MKIFGLSTFSCFIISFLTSGVAVAVNAIIGGLFFPSQILSIDGLILV